ncbi:MAG: Hint domain-containing protein [Rhodovulum sp.]|nr:Hint domain-containing protein [Rhodovulum sp.]
MANYDLRFYDYNPVGVIPTGTNDTFTWNGPENPTGTASVTDDGVGADGYTLDDNIRDENAVADVSINGVTSSGAAVEAERAWSLYDPVTGQTFEVIEFEVNGGGAAGSYTVSEIPLVPGREYTVVDYDTSPNFSAGEATFSAQDYESADNIVSGDDNANTINASYTGDPDGDQVDGGFGTGADGMGDVIDAGGGNDTIASGAGDDLIYGGTGADSISGGDGNDTILGDQDLTATTESLNWSAQGGDEADLASGFTQNTGDMNVSVSFASDGNNAPTYQVETSDANYTTGEDPFATNSSVELFGTGDGATSTTTIDFSAANGSVGNEVTDVTFRINDIDMSAGNHIDQLTVTAYDAQGNEVPVTLSTTGNDTINGNTVTSGSTLDTSADANGSVLVDIAGPVARIEISYSNVETNITAAGTHGVTVTDIYFDTMAVGDADTIDGGAGDDLIDAGDGDDLIQFTDGFGNDTVAGGETGESIGDILDFSALSAPVDGVYTGDEAGTFTSGANSVEFSEIENAILTSGNDTLDASASNSAIGIDAGAGDDAITGGAGNDYVIGGAGDDTLTGGDGANYLDGGSGDDTFVAGTGADTFDGGAGQDNIDYSASSGAVNVELGAFGNGTAALSGGDAENDSVAGGVDGVIGSAFDDTLIGHDFSGTGPDAYTNEIFGGDGNDYIDGAGAADSLAGDAGNDTIIGGTGADTIDGGTGDDTIYVAQGDTVTGGDGDDTFLLTDLNEAGSGDITITGGEGSESAGDTLDFQGLIGFKDITYTNTDDANGGNSGFATMADGSVVNFSEIENVIICFTAGTRVLTPQGQRDVADLRPGDPVLTADNGVQSVRWVGRRTVPAIGNLAPVRIGAGLFGNERELLVSPQHRMLLTGWRAQLLFGESEVLSPATHLVDDTQIIRQTGGEVTYVHIAFDRHEIVFAEGAPSESFHPGHVGLKGILDPCREELFRIFPELRSNIGAFGPTTRRSLKKHEVHALRAA